MSYISGLYNRYKSLISSIKERGRAALGRSFRQDIDGRSQADSLCFLSIVLHGMPANSVPMPALASQSLFKLC